MTETPLIFEPTTTQRRAEFIAGIAIAVVALALRFPQITESLWLDELHTAWCVSGNWGDVAPRAAIGNQSPLYFWFLRLVTGLLGPSELSLRLPSLVAGMALVGVVGVTTAKFAGSTLAGLFAATLVALDYHCIFYSQEARPYAVLQLVAWCHAYAVWQLVQRPTLVWHALFVLGAVLQFYLHYTSALFVAAELAFVLVILIANGRSAFRLLPLTADLAIIAVAVLPAAQHLQDIAAHREQWEQFIPPPTVASLFRTLQLDVYLLPTIAIIVGGILLQGLRKPTTVRNSESYPRQATWLVFCLLLVPTLLAWVANRQHVAALFLRRYLVSSLVAAPVGAAILGRMIPSHWLRGVVVATTAMITMWSSGLCQNWQRDGRFIVDRSQDWRSAVEFVNDHATNSNSSCFVRSGFVEADRLRSQPNDLLKDYCLAPVTSLYRLQMAAIPLTTRPPFDIQPQPNHSETWVILNGSAATRERFLTSRENPFRIVQSQSFGDVLVCEISDK